MEWIDKSQPVMVTGATGYVAGWIVKELLERGFTVHATVRNPKDTNKTQHLSDLAASSPGTLKLFKADLLEEGSFAEAMKDCALVYHTASPFTSNYSDPQKELIDPAVNGTRNVLLQASKTPSVKRVVLTSSCAAIYTDASEVAKTPKGILTEEIWNTTASLSHQPYSYSKTLAEKEAWNLVQGQNQWDLVVVNPSFVMGPSLNPKYSTSESIHILRQMTDGTMKMGVPNLAIGVVDVRDLAVAHLEAGMRKQAHGRNIINGSNTSMLEMAQILHRHFGKNHPIPQKALPKWLLMLVGPLINKSITRKFIQNNIGHIWRADNSKSILELGISYRSLEETMVDSFKAL